MRKVLASLLAALALTLGLVAITAAPAAASWNACPTGQGALFNDVNGGGEWLCVSFSGAGTACHNLTDFWNDRVSSVRVTYGSGYGMRLFLDANCASSGGEGHAYITVPHLKQTNLPDDPRWCGGLPVCDWNDRASSYQIVLA